MSSLPVTRARRSGAPHRELDLRAAKLLMDQGHSVREVSDLLGFPRSTLKRRSWKPETEGRGHRTWIQAPKKESKKW